ncbi:Uncharacterised protein [Yersinia frederiksenii]|nr:Uncharacterised protein [Yersinia frederiksenii]
MMILTIMDKLYSSIKSTLLNAKCFFFISTLGMSALNELQAL